MVTSFLFIGPVGVGALWSNTITWKIVSHESLCGNKNKKNKKNLLGTYKTLHCSPHIDSPCARLVQRTPPLIQDLKSI